MTTIPRKFKFLSVDTDRHGKERIYLRIKGRPKIRLRGDPNTDAFAEEYRKAIEGQVAPTRQKHTASPQGSLRALCESYYRSAEYKRLDLKTRHVRRLILDKLCDQYGSKPAALMEPRHVRNIRDAKAETPEAANSIVKALRAVFRQGMLAGDATSNPAVTIEYLQADGDGFHAWTMDEVHQFESRHPIGTTPRLALALLVYTGQRRSDIVQLGRQHVGSDGWLRFTQHKGRRRRPVTLTLPIVPELRRIIDASRTGDLTFLVSGRGTPYPSESFGNQFRRWCRDAGLQDCSAHGLRKLTGARLAELGCSAREIAAVLGHRTLKEVQRYTASADQRILAGSAMARLAEVSHQNKSSETWDGNGTQPIEKTSAC